MRRWGFARSKHTRIFLRDIHIHSQLIGSQYTLPVEESHYIARVVRLREGDTLELGDPSTGAIGIVRLVSLSERVTVEFQEIVAATSSDTHPLTILVALCKGQKNDQICDWATELGCSEILFWQATRSVVRLKDLRDCEHKQHRLEKIAIAAAQQSKQPKPPTVRVFASLHEALLSSQEIFNRQPRPLTLTCSLSKEARPIREVVQCARIHHGKIVVIGPEGDLTEQEESLLESHGFEKVSLGTRVLRSELAVVTALVSVQ